MNLNNLPWESIEDTQSINFSKKYLPIDPVIIEAGGCDCEDTKRFKDLWPLSTIYVFEPNPDLYVRCEQESKNLKDVYLSRFALSDQSGKRIFYKSDFQATSSFFKTNWENIYVPKTILRDLKVNKKEELTVYNEIQIEVDCITIDDFLISINRNEIDYLWLDVEGAELLVLNGAIKALETIKMVSIEYAMQEFRKGWCTFENLHSFLINKNFELKHIWKTHEHWTGNAIYVNRNFYE